MVAAVAAERLPIIRVSYYGIDVPGMVVRLRGLSALLMSNPVGLMEKAPGGIRGGEVAPAFSSEEVAERSAYRAPDGTLRFPASAIRSSFLAAAAGYNIPVPGRSRRLPLNKALVDLFVMPEDWVQVTRAGVPLRDYTIDTRRAVNKKTKGGVVTSRACIELPWEMPVTLIWSRAQANDTPAENEVFAQMVLENAERAGRQIGIGAFRPACTGWFGRYVVEVV